MIYGITLTKEEVEDIEVVLNLYLTGFTRTFIDGGSKEFKDLAVKIQQVSALSRPLIAGGIGMDMANGTKSTIFVSDRHYSGYQELAKYDIGKALHGIEDPDFIVKVEEAQRTLQRALESATVQEDSAIDFEEEPTIRFDQKPNSKKYLN